jgi:glycosyltransferase involved in cell wall biosynthesis
MNKYPTFSIIIPLYNSEDYISETLQSLANQTSQDFEVIIVDDGSSDNSVKVTKDFIRNTPSLNAKLHIDRPDNFPKGVSGSRNYGIHMSEGKWICFLDSDDLFHPQKIEIISKAIQNSSCQIVFHSAVDFNNDSKSLFNPIDHIEKIPFRIHNILNELLNKNRVNTSSVTIKKDLIEEIGYFDTDLFGIEDYYMWLNISKYSEWNFVDAALTGYRIRGDSLMGGRRFIYYINQNSKLIDKLWKNPIFTQEEKWKVKYYLMSDVMHYYASISLNKFGIMDFLVGIKTLIQKGYPQIAFTLLWKHLKFKILQLLIKNKK